MDQEAHLMLLKVCIHKIQLSVRFPCSLTFQLKIQSKSIDCRGTYELTKGACTPQQTLRLEIELERRQDETYRDKQAKIIVYMTSANGKIPAGSTTLSLGSLKAGSTDLRTSPIEKCPDKSATINYTFSLEFLRVVAKNNSNFKSSIVSGRQDSSIGSTSRVRYSGSPQVQNFRSGEKYKSSHDRKNSIHTSSYQTLVKNIAERDSQFDDRKGSRRSEFVDEIQIENKLVSLEKQRSQHMRQMSKLQKQISRKNLEEKTPTEDHYNRIKSQLNDVIAQNDSLKQKIKVFERRDKQQSQTIKQLRDDIERKKQKTYQQEFVRMESQSILQDKQKLIKEMQIQLKQYEEDINDLKISLNTQQKRIEFKQASFKDQLTKLNEKYQQSQLERQKAVVELNSMLEELEASEKKHQLTIKEKDKIHADEKNKLVKKSQAFSRTIEQQKQQIDEKSIEISDLQREIKILQGKLNQFQTQASELKIEGKSSAYELQKERQHNRELLKQLQKAQEIQNLYTDLKKKYQQLELSDQNNKKVLQASNKNNQQIQGRIKQFEQQIAAKSQQISSLMTKIFTLNSQIEGYKRQQQNSNREVENLSQNNLNAANKIEELRMKLDKLQYTYNQLESQSEEQIAYMIKTKQYLEHELEETKWNYEKIKDTNEQINQKNKTLSNTILEFNRKIMEMEEKISKGDQLLADAKSTILVLNQDKQMQISKQKDLQEKLKQKNEQIYEFNKKINKIEREHYMAMQKLKHTENFYSEKLESEEGMNKAKQNKINEIIDSMSKLQIDLIAKEQLINTLQATQSKMLMESEYLTEQLKLSKKQNGELEQALGHFKQEIISTTDKLNLTCQNLEKEINLKNQLSQNLTKKSKEFEDWRSANNAALQQLFLEIAKDLNPNTNISESTGILFPDDKLSNLQVEALKKRNNLLIKYQGQIRTLEINLKNMEEEMNRTKKLHGERQQELQAIIQNQKSKFKSVHSDLSLEKQELLEKISNLEDRLYEMTAESEKIGIENDENKIVIGDQENYISQLNFEIDNYKNEIKALQQAIKILKEENAKIKFSFENSLLSTTEESSMQIDKLKKLINQGQRKANGLEKAIIQKEQTISKLQNELENIGHQKQKVDQKLAELTNRFSELSQERKSGVENQRNYEKATKKLEQKILGLENEISQLNKKIDSYAIEKKKLQDALSQQQITKTKLFGQLETAVQHSIQLESALKDNGDKSKKVGEKASQEIKKLKEQIVGLNSSIELKSFEITQHQGTIKSLKATNHELSQQLQSKKQELGSLQSKFEEAKNSNILITQQLETTLGEKISLETEVKSIKEAMLNLQQMLNQNQSNLDTLVLKDREITKLKEQINTKDRNYEKTLADIKGQFNEAKKQIATRAQREEEFKKKVRELENQIQNNLYDAEAQKRGWQQTAENQRKQLIYELEGVKDENKLLAEQFQFQREQMNHQLDQASQQIAQLKQVISESQYHLENTSAQSAEQTERIKNLEFQLKNCKQEWQREKLAYIPTQKQFKQLENQIARYQKYAVELEKKNKQLTEVAKKRLTEQQKTSCGELLRQINTVILRNKSKIITRVGEREREQVLADFKQIHQKIESAIKSNLIYK